RTEDLPITVLAGRLPVAGSMTEVAVTDGYLERLDLNRKNPGSVVGTVLELGAPRFFDSLDQRQLRGRWSKAEIVGVVAQEAGDGEIVAPIQAARMQQSWSASGGEGAGLALPTSPYS